MIIYPCRTTKYFVEFIVQSGPGSRGHKCVRGKSELHRAGCWVTPSRGDLKESATETYRLDELCNYDFCRNAAFQGKGEKVR